MEETSVEIDSNLVSLYGWDIKLEQVALGPTVVGSDAHNGLINRRLAGFKHQMIQRRPHKMLTFQHKSHVAMIIWRQVEIFHTVSQGTFTTISDNLRVNGGDVIHGPYLISQTQWHLTVATYSHLDGKAK